MGRASVAAFPASERREIAPSFPGAIGLENVCLPEVPAMVNHHLVHLRNQFGGIGYVEFYEQFLTIPLDGFRAESHTIGNLWRCVSFREKVKDVLFKLRPVLFL